MKKLMMAVLLAAVAVSQSFAKTTYSVFESAGTAENASYVDNKSDNGFRSSFFWRANTGFSSEFFEIYHETNSSSYTGEYSGIGEYVSAEFGVNFKRLFAVFFGMDFTIGSGDFCVRSSCYDASLSKFDINLGTLFYPFRSSSALKGLNFGSTIGFVGEFITLDRDNENVADEPGISLKFEVGYVWDVTRRISLGVEFYYTINAMFSTEDYDYYEYEESSGATVGLLFTVMRR